MYDMYIVHTYHIQYTYYEYVRIHSAAARAELFLQGWEFAHSLIAHSIIAHSLISLKSNERL